MKKLFSFSLLALMCFFAAAQTVTFTGRDASSHYVQLNRVVVTNLTKGWQQTLFWPDTALTMETTVQNGITGIGDVEMQRIASLQLSQNNPNPFNATTEVRLNVAEIGDVTLTVTDMNGRVVAGANNYSPLQAGIHQFRITLAQSGIYIMTAIQDGKTSSIKMVCNGGGSANRIENQGVVETQNFASPQPKSNGQSFANNLMEYVGYATIDGVEMESRHIKQEQGVSENFTFQFAIPYKGAPAEKKSEDFRVALSLSPFSLNQFEKGYSFAVGDKTASTPEELQNIYRELGSTEMYVRIATKRHKTAEDVTDGQPDENANVHTFDQGIHLCEIAAALNIPINPEIMCAYTYMDMDKQQAPRFEEYPEFNFLMNGKKWEELTLDEICTVLEAYGAFVGEAILSTGCTVNNWNLGNEANFGFAGISMGLKTAVDPKLEKAGTLKKYLAPVFARGWLKKHVWKHDAKAYAAVKRGILSAYAKLGIDDSNVKFSTHVATVVFPAGCTAKFFNFMKDNGYEMETAGISYYPSAPSMALSKKRLLKKTVKKINKKCGLNVFIGEFSYPSGKMDGPFAGWNKKVKGYKHDQQGQANIYADVIKWGKANGMAGIRYWAPDYEGWYAMSMFEFSNKKGTAKSILTNHKGLIEK
ncbi:MAG: glycosyl hydrolase 53 family protein [Bacteroidales bacterium]|nr:glycosyl hydrolase 53 family protein [Bacteroidales bacterium]